MGTVKCIGILTSGGDAPGMNAAIRAVTRAAIYNGLQVKGIYRGYKGLVTGEIKEFKSQNVSNIIQLGGTILKTARCKEFTTPEGRQLAYDNMKREGIDALVIIVSYVFAWWLKFLSGILDHEVGVLSFEFYMRALLLIVPVYILLFCLLFMRLMLQEKRQLRLLQTHFHSYCQHSLLQVLRDDLLIFFPDNHLPFVHPQSYHFQHLPLILRIYFLFLTFCFPFSVPYNSLKKVPFS